MLNEKPIIPYVNNDFIGLEMLKEVHLGLIFMARNISEIRKWFLTSKPLIWKNHLNWFSEYSKKSNDIVFIIVDEINNNKPIGQLALYDIDYQNGVAEYGRCMIWDEEALGKGFLEKASRLLADISKKQLGINKWFLDVKSDNTKAIYIYEKLGFKKTGEVDSIVKMELLL